MLANKEQTLKTTKTPLSISTGLISTLIQQKLNKKCSSLRQKKNDMVKSAGQWETPLKISRMQCFHYFYLANSDHLQQSKAHKGSRKMMLNAFGLKSTLTLFVFSFSRTTQRVVTYVVHAAVKVHSKYMCVAVEPTHVQVYDGCEPEL